MKLSLITKGKLYAASFLGLFTTPFLTSAEQTTPITYTMAVNLPGITSEVASGGASYFMAVVQLAIAVAAVLAVIVMVIAGIEYVGGAASPSARSDAKERIWGALIGLLIALGSFLVLNSINPDLTIVGVADDRIISDNLTPTAGVAAGTSCFAVEDTFTYDRLEYCYTDETTCEEQLVAHKNNSDEKILFAGGCYDLGTNTLTYQFCKVVGRSGPLEEYCFSGWTSTSKTAVPPDCVSFNPSETADPPGCYELSEGVPFFQVKISQHKPPADPVVIIDTVTTAAACFKILQGYEVRAQHDTTLTIDNSCGFAGFQPRP